MRTLEAQAAALDLTCGAEYLDYISGDPYSQSYYCDGVLLTAPQDGGERGAIAMYLTVPNDTTADHIRSVNLNRSPISSTVRVNGSSTPNIDPQRHTPADALRSVGAAILTIGLPILRAGGRHLNSLTPHDTALWVDAVCEPANVDEIIRRLQANGARPNNRLNRLYNLPLPGLRNPSQPQDFYVQYGLNTDRTDLLDFVK